MVPLGVPYSHRRTLVTFLLKEYTIRSVDSPEAR